MINHLFNCVCIKIGYRECSKENKELIEYNDLGRSCLRQIETICNKCTFHIDVANINFFLELGNEKRRKTIYICTSHQSAHHQKLQKV